jgi:large subunit ribosomal protein L31
VRLKRFHFGTKNRETPVSIQIVKGHIAIWVAIPIFAVLLGENAITDMKKGIHPEYKEVVFWDTSSDHKFLTRSTQTPKETIKWEDGKEYPLIKVEVSSASHPFFTGKKLFVDTAGRVEKFKNKYQKKA